MFAQFIGDLTRPARRRMWITVGSGTLILLALVAGFALRSDAAWAAFMTAAALLAASDIAEQEWQALRVRHLGIRGRIGDRGRRQLRPRSPLQRHA